MVNHLLRDNHLMHHLNIQVIRVMRNNVRGERDVRHHYMYHATTENLWGTI
jgi:hypothetical protein